MEMTPEALKVIAREAIRRKLGRRVKIDYLRILYLCYLFEMPSSFAILRSYSNEEADLRWRARQL